MATTTAAITIVEAISRLKFPESVARLIVAPRPTVENICPLKWKYSAMMLTFQAPPDAVTRPVIRYGKMPGRMSLRHLAAERNLNTAAASFKSLGIAIAPAITLNKMYHCV